MLLKVADLLKIRPRNEYRIETARDGIRCFGSTERAQTIEWGKISEIEGYKRDQVTTDLICLAIKYYDGAAQIVEINEDMKGFGDAVRELEGRGFLKSDWRKIVTLPPFNTRKFILFTSSKTY